MLVKECQKVIFIVSLKASCIIISIVGFLGATMYDKVVLFGHSVCKTFRFSSSFKLSHVHLVLPVSLSVWVDAIKFHSLRLSPEI